MALSDDRKQFSITVDSDLYKQIEDYKYEKRFPFRTNAINDLILRGISTLEDYEVNLETGEIKRLS